MDFKKYRIGKLFISITNPSDAVSRIETAVEEQLNTYVCVPCFRCVEYAENHDDYVEIMNHSYLSVPDGMPLVWAAKLWGFKQVNQTSGPDVFKTMLLKKENGIKHFLIGDTEDTLKKIVSIYKDDVGALIVGTYSPPFCDLDSFDYESYGKIINESRANIVWVSMTSPKQDYFGVRLLPYLDKKIVICVGAAFRFALGEYNYAIPLLRKMGLNALSFRKLNFSLFWYYIKASFHFAKYSIDIVYCKLKKQKSN